MHLLVYCLRLMFAAAIAMPIMIGIVMMLALVSGGRASIGITTFLAFAAGFVVVLMRMKPSQGHTSGRSFAVTRHPIPADLMQISDGIDFEHYIAQKLGHNGMACMVTASTGDQGVDVIATTRRGTRIAIQTKLYSSPVSNKAVQEVHAGQRFYQCATAIVVTNATFTKSARDLANTIGVTLIDCNDLTLVEDGTHAIYAL